MITSNCLLEVACLKMGTPSQGCPFNRPDMFHSVNLLQINCSTWNTFRESDKERRLRYAQEKRARDEIKGSRGQAGNVEA